MPISEMLPMAIKPTTASTTTTTTITTTWYNLVYDEKIVKYNLMLG